MDDVETRAVALAERIFDLCLGEDQVVAFHALLFCVCSMSLEHSDPMRCARTAADVLVEKVREGMH
jgi:hypothetical protein